ncbi:neuronal cell adhesion molecule-like isoform X1 [Petromyzon marinus]|uniref:neuronal cell adhesion molecule-like isoform X1 n=2 Tax=Petromyzon marinus TaxID=7757 RepID=UPI003F6EA30E
MDAFTTARFVALLLAVLGDRHHPLALPLDLTHPPSIRRHSPLNYIVEPQDNIVMECEAQGNPTPKFRWSKDGRRFDPGWDPNVKQHGNGSGTFTVDTAAVLAASGGQHDAMEAYEGVYRCLAENRHGTALTANIAVRLARAPAWPLEDLSPVFTVEGSPAVLRCNPPHGFPPPDIFWLDGSMQRVRLDARVSQSLDGDLYFANVLPGDVDYYVCCTRYPRTGTIQQKEPIWLIVKPAHPSKRRPVFVEPGGETSSKLVLQGETLLLGCIVQGLPTPQLRWAKVDGELPSGRITFGAFNQTLVIRHVLAAHAGDYRCHASNSEGRALHTFTVTVEAKPYWIAPEPESRVYAPWDTVELACLADGIPKPLVRWFFNGIPVNEAPVVSGRSVDGDSLSLRRLDGGATGVYQCEASNRHGTILANAYVKVPAVPPQMLSEQNRLYVAREGEAVYMECAVFSWPPAEFLWFKDSRNLRLQDERHRTFNNGTLRVIAARREDTDSYVCIAVNDVDSRLLRVHLLVEVVDDGEEDQEVEEDYGEEEGKEEESQEDDEEEQGEEEGQEEGKEEDDEEEQGEEEGQEEGKEEDDEEEQGEEEGQEEVKAEEAESQEDDEEEQGEEEGQEEGKEEEEDDEEEQGEEEGQDEGKEDSADRAEATTAPDAGGGRDGGADEGDDDEGDDELLATSPGATAAAAGRAAVSNGVPRLGATPATALLLTLVPTAARAALLCDVAVATGAGSVW